MKLMKRRHRSRQTRKEIGSLSQTHRALQRQARVEIALVGLACCPCPCGCGEEGAAGLLLEQADLCALPVPKQGQGLDRPALDRLGVGPWSVPKRERHS